MNNFIAGIFLILCVACTVTNSGDKVTGHKDVDSILLELKENSNQSLLFTPLENNEAFSDYSDFNKTDTSKALVFSDSISIFTDKNNTVTFRNSSADVDVTSAEKYSYKGYDSKTNFHWIVKERYEDAEDILVDQKNGKTTKVSNNPVGNSSGTMFFTKQNQCFLVFEDCSPGFQLWKVLNGELKLMQEVHLKNYFIVDGGWTSSGKLIVEVASIKEFMNTGKTSSAKKYELILK